MGNNRKWLGWISIAVALTVVIGVPVWILMHRTEAMIRSELARIAAEGSPVTIEDLAGKPIPDATNGALIYQKAFDLVHQHSNAKEMTLLVDAISNEPSSGTTVDWSRVRAILARNEGAVQLAEQAQSMPECKFPVDWSGGPVEVLYPHFSKMRNLSRVVGASALMSAKDGRPADALKTLRIGFMLGDSITDAPNLIQVLVRIALINISSNALRQCLACGDVPEADAITLSNELAKIDISDGPSNGFKAERVNGIWLFNKVRQEGPGYILATAASSKAPGTPYEPTPEHIRRCDNEELYYLNKMRGYIEVARMSYKDAVDQNCEIDYPKDVPPDAMLCNIFMMPPKGVMKARDRAQAEINGSRIALALAAYHTRHKSYPTLLKDVAGIMGGKVPADVFSGNQYVYRLQGNGYLLYSIGANLIDDGGKQSDHTDEGDIVWIAK